jgi:hypothetical protein
MAWLHTAMAAFGGMLTIFACCPHHLGKVANNSFSPNKANPHHKIGIARLFRGNAAFAAERFAVQSADGERESSLISLQTTMVRE